MDNERFDKVREIIIALLRSDSEGMNISDIWRGIQNRGIEVGYNELEDWLLDQLDLVQVSSDGRILLNPSVDTSRIRRTRVVPDVHEISGDVDSASRIHRLVKYYIDCLREEGKSIASYREHQNSSFVLLDEELYSKNKGFASVQTSAAGGFAKNVAGNTRAAYYGYPLLLDWVETGDGEFADYRVIPVFIARLEIQEEAEKSIFHLPLNSMRLNPQIMKSVRWKDQSFIRTRLDADPEHYSSFEERLAMLTSLFPHIDENEKLDPNTIFRSTSLSMIDDRQGGFYNRSGIFLGGANPYIKGLVRDLEQMQDKPSEIFQQTALAPLVRSVMENKEVSEGALETIKVLSLAGGDEILNAQQENAVKQAFANQMSVVTGPPGTGKSQVVTAILTSAVLQGKTVLFASRNNKALEVVRERLKKLCPDPHALMRVGGDYDKECGDILDRMGNLPSNENVMPFDQQMKGIDLQLSNLDALENDLNVTAQLLSEANLAEEIFDGLKKKLLPGCENAYELVSQFDKDKLIAVAKRLKRLMGIWSPLLTLLALYLQAHKGSDEIDLLNSELEKLSINVKLKWPEKRKDLHSIFKKLLSLTEIVKSVHNKKVAAQKLGEADNLNIIYEKIYENKQMIAKKVPELLMAKVRANASGQNMSEATQEALLQYRNTMPLLKGSRLNDEQKRLRLVGLGHLFPNMLQRLPAWAVTNLSVSHRVPLEPAIFDLVVIDEASQCDIASCFPLLFRAKKAVVIGDPLQLSQITQISQNLEDQILRQQGLDGPENDHLRYSEKSMYDAARCVTHTGGYQFLSSHYRCHSDIIGFANTAHWYDDRLNVFTDNNSLKRPNWWKRGIEWNQVSSEIGTNSFKKYYLVEEVEKVVEIVHDLLENKKYEGTVGVVCPLRCMVDRIRDGVDKRVHASLIQGAKFEAQTAHGFQGDERDVIIYAMAVHPNMPRGSAWFIAENSNLFNVALSRARAVFVVVGDKAAVSNFTFENRPVAYLNDFVKYVDSISEDKPKVQGRPIFTEEQRWEEKLYVEALEPAGIPVVSQYALGPYKLDFGLIRVGKNRKLDIEVDGEKFHKDSAGRRLRRDIDRDIYVKAQDGRQWDVMRFWVYELKEDMESCLKKIQKWMNSVT